MHDDSLYRVSLKCLIKNDKGELLLVKEAGRDFWDLPGGGMDHGENIDAAIARELLEEVGYLSDFTYRVVGLDEPIQLLSREVWQLRVILDVTPNEMTFSVGVDADEIQFMDPALFKDAELAQERKIYEYAQLI
jgi:8-oxo-dGTP pyrophosphatase MutT (NUDIX family)